MLQDDRQCSLMPITPTKLMQSIPFPWSLLFTNYQGQQNTLIFYFYNCILQYHCYFLCCSPYTPWFLVQFLQGQSEIWDKTRVWTPVPPTPVSFLWGTYHSTQHHKHQRMGSPQKRTILTLSVVIQHQNCPFSLHKTIRELKKNQKQIPHEAPHLTPAHCGS